MAKSLVAAFTSGLGSVRAKDFGPVPVRSSLFGWLREPYAGGWQAGVQPEGIGGMLGYSPIYACASRIANDVGKLDICLREQMDNGTSVDAEATSPYWSFIRKPNDFQNRIQFVTMWMLMKLLHGNAYVLKVRDGRGIPTGGYLLDPRRVTPLVTPDGDVYYQVASDYLARVPSGVAAVPAREMIHDRMNTLWHPLVGVPPIFACALSGTLGLKIQRNSAAFFGNMSRPSGILTSPGTIDDATAIRLKSEWEKNFSAENIGRLAVAGDGLTYDPINVAAEQSQLVEQLDASVADVARAFGVPLYKIGAGQMPTNNNVEALNQQYYGDCLQVHIESAELCLDEGVGLPAKYCYEFDLDGLMRMDQVGQAEVLTKLTKGGLMKPNEGRRRLNLPPVAGGDSCYMQVQDTSLAALAKRDAMAPAAAPGAPAAPAAPPADQDDAQDKGVLRIEVDPATIERALQPVAEQVAVLREQFDIARTEEATRRDAEVATAAAALLAAEEAREQAVTAAEDARRDEAEELALALIHRFSSAEAHAG